MEKTLKAILQVEREASRLEAHARQREKALSSDFHRGLADVLAEAHEALRREIDSKARRHDALTHERNESRQSSAEAELSSIDEIARTIRSRVVSQFAARLLGLSSSSGNEAS